MIGPDEHGKEILTTEGDNAEVADGDGRKRIYDSELPVMLKLRRDDD